MKLETLTIKNFRGLKDFKVAFAPYTTVVIGRNGAGKSTLLDAIKMALSFIFANNKSLGNDFLSAGNPSLNVISFDNNDFNYDKETGTIAADASVKATAEYANIHLDWELYKRSTSNASLYTTKYQDAFNKFMKKWKEENAELPLIACFSDSFPHKPTKQTKFAIDSILKKRIPVNFGYYQWDLDTACTSIWETRLCNQLAHIAPLYSRASRLASALEQAESKCSAEQLQNNTEYMDLKNSMEQLNKIYNPLHEEIEYVQSRLVRFSSMLPKLNDEGYDLDYFVTATTELGYELSLIFKNGNSKLLKNLPAGYCRLYSIVLELSYRAYILNGNKEPKGVVLIDEIDLHLHPSLEQEVVKCLRDVFPAIQFILTSHSGAVITNLDTVETVADERTKEPVKKNQVLFMQDGKEEPSVLNGTYGLDYNSALRDFMDTPSSNTEIKLMGDRYLVYCSLGLTNEANTVLQAIVEKLGAEDHPFVSNLKEKSKTYEVH